MTTLISNLLLHIVLKEKIAGVNGRLSLLPKSKKSRPVSESHPICIGLQAMTVIRNMRDYLLQHLTSNDENKLLSFQTVDGGHVFHGCCVYKVSAKCGLNYVQSVNLAVIYTVTVYK